MTTIELLNNKLIHVSNEIHELKSERNRLQSRSTEIQEKLFSLCEEYGKIDAMIMERTKKYV